MDERNNCRLTVAEVIEAAGNPVINGKDIDKTLRRTMVRSHFRNFQSEIYKQFEAVLKLLKV